MSCIFKKKNLLFIVCSTCGHKYEKIFKEKNKVKY